MKKIVSLKNLVLATLTVGVALISSQASARTILIPGGVCQPVQGSGGCIEYSQYGVHNICSGTATVECPLPVDEPNGSLPNVYQLYMGAYDRSTVANVSCTVTKLNTDGNPTYTGTLSTGGGGVGASIQLPIVFPNVTSDGWWRLRCSIPGVQTAGWFSHVTEILIGTAE